MGKMRQKLTLMLLCDDAGERAFELMELVPGGFILIKVTDVIPAADDDGEERCMILGEILEVGGRLLLGVFWRLK